MLINEVLLSVILISRCKGNNKSWKWALKIVQVHCIRHASLLHLSARIVATGCKKHCKLYTRCKKCLKKTTGSIDEIGLFCYFRCLAR